jgi:hypothetical protein
VLTEKELKLFALLEPNQIEKERILQNKNISLSVRIRLGDTTAIPDLISKYEHEDVVFAWDCMLCMAHNLILLSGFLNRRDRYA